MDTIQCKRQLKNMKIHINVELFFMKYQSKSKQNDDKLWTSKPIQKCGKPKWLTWKCVS